MNTQIFNDKLYFVRGNYAQKPNNFQGMEIHGVYKETAQGHALSTHCMSVTLQPPALTMTM
jgi:hypothetical protein